jgi:hypothetical protein
MITKNHHKLPKATFGCIFKGKIELLEIVLHQKPQKFMPKENELEESCKTLIRINKKARSGETRSPL